MLVKLGTGDLSHAGMFLISSVHISLNIIVFLRYEPMLSLYHLQMLHADVAGF